MALASDDLRALRDYVTAGSNMQAQSESTVLLAVTHSNLKARFMEIRFDRHVRRSVWEFFVLGGELSTDLQLQANDRYHESCMRFFILRHL